MAPLAYAKQRDAISHRSPYQIHGSVPRFATGRHGHGHAPDSDVVLRPIRVRVNRFGPVAFAERRHGTHIAVSIAVHDCDRLSVSPRISRPKRPRPRCPACSGADRALLLAAFVVVLVGGGHGTTGLLLSSGQLLPILSRPPSSAHPTPNQRRIAPRKRPLRLDGLQCLSAILWPRCPVHRQPS